MGFFRKILSVLLALLVLLPLSLPGAAVEEEHKPLIQELLAGLLEEKSQISLNRTLRKLEAADLEEGQKWRTIVDSWQYIEKEMPVYEKVLPDGLPQDDSLAIVVMGYQLNDNGSMKPELLDRLSVAIRSARKYPNAWIVCTGGATSRQESITEAGEMARWLMICGIEEDRIIVEDASYSTTENARNTCEILQNGYENIRSLAIITSDYHIRRSCLMFQSAALCGAAQTQTSLEVVGNAVCKVENAREESIRTKVWGLAILADVEMPE